MSDMKPTEEQSAVIEAVKGNHRVAVEAYAGCGKTTTLQLLAETLGKRMVYTAFNKAIVESSRKKMPENVRVATTHSLAWATHADRRRIFDMGRQLGFEQAKILGVDPLVVPVGDRTRRLAAGWIAAVGINTLGRWCDSGDAEITRAHVAWPRVVVEDVTGDWESAKHHIAQAAVEVAQAAWADVTNPRGRLKWDHSYYLKMFQLDGVVLPDCEMVLLDEAQDTNGVTMAILETQAKAGAQLVLVGDQYQEIYAWRGALNAMNRMEVDARVPLTGSWRFGPALADVANLILVDTLGAKLPLRGLNQDDGVFGQAEKPDAVLGRTNAAVIMEAMKLKEKGVAVQVMGGTHEVVSFVRAAQKLQTGKRCEHPDLGAFENWDQVVQYVDNDPAGDDLALMVQLINKFTCSVLLATFERTDGKIGGKPEVVLSTGHKAKGLEWPTVRLLDDFHGPRFHKTPVRPGEQFTNGESLRLLYVAATRAQRHLDGTAVPFLDLAKADAVPAS